MYFIYISYFIHNLYFTVQFFPFHFLFHFFLNFSVFIFYFSYLSYSIFFHHFTILFIYYFFVTSEFDLYSTSSNMDGNKIFHLRQNWKPHHVSLETIMASFKFSLIITYFLFPIYFILGILVIMALQNVLALIA